ncbi:hypothetical protein MMC18_004668 [Xylographa bjoerkii]|nr:hypothetical protein [Xylographa bjoerkii]
MCLICAEREAWPEWLCTETHHFLDCLHLVVTKPSICGPTCLNVPVAQPRLLEGIACQRCDDSEQLFQFLRALYALKVVEEVYKRIQDRLKADRSFTHDPEDIIAREEDIEARLKDLRTGYPRVLWLAYAAGDVWQLHKALFKVDRETRRRSKDRRRRHYTRWLELHERKATLFYTNGLKWLLKERPNVLVKKLLAKPLRFYDYVKLRHHEPYDIVQIRYRIGVVQRILLSVGWGSPEFDPEKAEIFSHLVKDMNSCYAEALPLEFLEQLEDIMSGYVDNPLKFDEVHSKQLEVIELSDHELEDGDEVNAKFWEQLAPSPDESPEQTEEELFLAARDSNPEEFRDPTGSDSDHDSWASDPDESDESDEFDEFDESDESDESGSMGYD